VLRLAGEQVESLFDQALPIEVRELPADLARLDVLLADAALLAPIAERWEAAARDRGRPTIAMARLMVVKQRTGWGYETVVGEVSDSFHLRRFVGLSVTAAVPHESTVRKLARRVGPEVIDEITRVVIETAVREKRFRRRRGAGGLDGRGGGRALAIGCGKLSAAARLDELADRAEKVDRQISQRVAGERISDRLVSLADPDARPIGKGKLGKRYEFGYVFELAEVTENTRRGARGLILPAASKIRLTERVRAAARDRRRA
jgi:hypothetical protein